MVTPPADTRPDDGVTEAAAGDPVALTRALVAVPSVNPSLEEGGAGEEAVARRAAGWLDGWGFDVTLHEVAPGRFNVVARHGVPGPTLLLNGHLDTVGVAGMTIAPFGAELRGGEVTGRGACDMKGGVACLLAAARSLAAEGHGGEIVVALTADEEHASLGMQAVVAAGVSADAAVVCEPTDLAVMPAHKGFVWVEVDFEGRAAHGSRPEKGIDAIVHAARYLTALDDLAAALRARPPHPLLGHGSFHAGTVAGGSAASVYPGRCTLVLERRTLPGETVATVEAEFREVLEALGRRLPDLRAHLRVTLDRPGTEVPVGSALVRGLEDACRSEGLEPRVEGMTAWVDAAFLNEAGIPAVCFGPGSIGRAHTVDEAVPVDELTACAAVLTRFARGFLGET